MQKKLFEELKDKHVKIKTKDSFLVDGYILEIYDDCFRFKSKYGISIMTFDDVAMLMEVGR
jgi:hypothetical protein